MVAGYPNSTGRFGEFDLPYVDDLIHWVDFSNEELMGYPDDGDNVNSAFDTQTGSMFFSVGGPAYKKNVVAGTRAVVQFQGAELLIDGSAATWTQPFHVYLVYSVGATTAGTPEELIQNNTGPKCWMRAYETPGGDVGLFLNCGTRLNYVNSSVVSNDFHLAEFIANGASSQIWWQGALGASGNAGTNGMQSAFLGGNATTRMNMAELVVRSSIDTGAKQAAMQDHFNRKYVLDF